MRTQQTDNYRFIIERVELEHFTEEEVERIRSWMNNPFMTGILYHVRAQNGRSIHVPPDLNRSFFDAIGTVIHQRVEERLEEENPPAPEGPSDLEFVLEMQKQAGRKVDEESSEEWLATKGIDLSGDEEPEVELSEDEKAEILAELKTLGLETDD